MVRGSPDWRIWLGLIITFGWLLLGSLYVSAAIGWVNLNRVPADELGMFSRRLLEKHLPLDDEAEKYALFHGHLPQHLKDNSMQTTCTLAFISLMLGATAAVAAPADRFAEVEVTSTAVGGSVHMLVGSGGNIGVSVGADGTLLVDDQFAPLAERIQQAINDIGGDKPKLILNTHFHGDHTGSNAHFGTAGTIIAHDNVRVRLVNADDVNRVALPVVTFDDRIRLFFNDDEIEVIHLPAGHTDGDSVVWFKNANVIHLGDQFFNGSFPFIDLQSGGSVNGFVENLEAVLEMIPEDIRIISGHGELGNVVQVAEAIEMIRATQAQVNAEMAAGQNDPAIIAASLDDRWASWGQGFINAERWVQILQADATGVTPSRR